MYKNMTKKGLALGAGIALVASGLAAVPAQADTTGPVTLVPTAGTTFNSILQSGFSLKSEIDPFSASAEEAGALSYLIENPGAAAIGATFDTLGSLPKALSFQTDVAPTASAFTSMTKSNRISDLTEARLTSNAITSSNKYVYMTGFSDNDVTVTHAASITGTAAAEVVTLTELLVLAGVLTIVTPAGVTLTHTLTNANTAGEIQTGLRADADYAGSDITLAVAASAGDPAGDAGADEVNIVLTQKNPGNVGAYTVSNAAAGADYSGAGGSGVIITTSGVSGSDAAGYNFGTLTTGGENTLALTTTETTKNVTLYVTAWLDADGDGVVDTFEKSSDRETVILYAASAVSAVTTVDSIVVGTKVLRSTVVYGNDVNPHMVAADTGVEILKDGVAFAPDAAQSVGATGIMQGVISASTIAGNLGITKNTITVGPAAANGNSTAIFAANATVGIYSAIAVYNTSGAQTFLTAANVRMGAPSRVLDLSAGNNADVDQLTLDVTNTANYKETITGTEEIYVRAGTKSVTFGVQARDAALVLKAANIDVRATVSETALDAAAEITISGSTGKLVDGGAAIVAYGVTDSNGQATFTVTSKNGKAADAIDVVLQYKNAAGVWTLINARAGGGADVGGVDGGLDIKWFATAFSALTPKPAAYVSGANPVVTFAVTDQWSQAVSEIDDTRLSVYASAYLGGVEDATVYAERVNVVDGLAAFTFANFAAAGSTAELRAVLYKGASTEVTTSNVTVYNTADTSAINVGTSFKTDITYNDYVTGSSTDTTVAAALAATGLGADTVSATIAGNVNNTTGSGQPGAAVTLSADGVLFFDSAAKVYALDTITTTSNEYGAWTVSAYSHTVNTKGAIVSITSGTVTASTKLITYLPKDLLTRDNLVFSFDVPATLVMNTTYVVVAKLADKWGNPVQTSGDSGSVSVVGNGSVQVNGVTAATVKDFDVKGESTVFVRSLKDIAGPSSVSATLLAVDSQYPIDPDVNGGANGELGLDSFGTLLSTTIDVTGTAWDETTFDKVIATERDVLETAPVVVSDTKVNVGTFKGYVALYAKGYKGQKMSAIVAGKWIVIPTLASDFERVVRFTGAGYTITTKLYIDGEQVGDAFTTLTK